MLAPALSDHASVKPPFLPQCSFIEQILGPILQRPLEPFPYRNAETRFWTLKQRPGCFAVEQFPKDMFAGPATDIQIDRDSGRNCSDAMIEIRRPSLKRDAHRSPIHFAEDIVW